MSDTPITPTNAASTNPGTPGSAPPAAERPRPPRLYKLRVMFGMLPDPSGRPSFIWVERWNAFIVAALIGLGLPLLGLSGFSIETKKWILIGWLAVWLLFYFYFEGRELVGQMQGRGSIESQQYAEQVNTAQDPFYGVILAIVIWLLVLAVHIARMPIVGSGNLEIAQSVFSNIGTGFSTTPVTYGFVEWIALAHVWFGTTFVNQIVYNTGTIFSKAAPMGERTERRLPR